MTPFFEQLPNVPIVLDASAIINLLGCKEPENVLRALAVPCFIEERTFGEIRHHPIAGLCYKKICAPLFDKKIIEIHRMSAHEYELYLNLVGGKPSENLGDGESAAIAVAASCNRIVILDDRKARRIISEKFPSVRYTSSLQLFIAAGYKAGWSNTEILSLVVEARMNSKMNIVRGEEPIFTSLSI